MSHPHEVSTATLLYNKDHGILVATFTDILDPTERTPREICLVSHKTGNKKLFSYDDRVCNEDGIVLWAYKEIGGDLKLVVYND